MTLYSGLQLRALTCPWNVLCEFINCYKFSILYRYICMNAQLTEQLTIANVYTERTIGQFDISLKDCQPA